MSSDELGGEDPGLADLPARFELEARLGRGGMASVYLATDATTQTRVALKVLHPHLRDDKLVVARFRREIAAARRIEHPNIIRIHDLIETPRLDCLVLEYQPGGDLKQVIRRRGALPMDEAIAIARQLLAGLAVAHKAGVVHRDIKPHNVLVDEEGLAKIAATYYEEGHTAGLKLLRVAAKVRAEHGRDAVGPLYAAYGTHLFDTKRDQALQAAGHGPTWQPGSARDLVEAALANAGLPTGLADARTTRRSTTGTAFFGPVITGLPSPEDSVRLWDHVIALAEFPGFAEFKRSSPACEWAQRAIRNSRPLRLAMKHFARAHIRVYQRTNGRIGAKLLRFPAALITMTGRYRRRTKAILAQAYQDVPAVSGISAGG